MVSPLVSVVGSDSSDPSKTTVVTFNQLLRIFSFCNKIQTKLRLDFKLLQNRNVGAIILRIDKLADHICDICDTLTTTRLVDESVYTLKSLQINNIDDRLFMTKGIKVTHCLSYLPML